MPTSTQNSEEIIEKRDSNPVVTSCLVLACVFTVVALTLQIAETAELRSGYTDSDLQKGKTAHIVDETKDFERQVKAALEKGTYQLQEHIKKLEAQENTLRDERVRQLQELIPGAGPAIKLDRGLTPAAPGPKGDADVSAPESEPSDGAPTEAEAEPSAAGTEPDVKSSDMPAETPAETSGEKPAEDASGFDDDSK
jgi:hypothetical protein